MENKQHSDLEISNSMEFFIWRTTAADAVGRPRWGHVPYGADTMTTL